MKLIKAYIRTNMIDKVVHALEEAGFSDMTIIGSRFHFHQRSEAQTGYLRHGQPRRRQFVRRRFAKAKNVPEEKKAPALAMFGPGRQ